MVALTVDSNNVIQTVTCASGYIPILNGATSTTASATASLNTVVILGCISCGGAQFATCSLVS